MLQGLAVHGGSVHCGITRILRVCACAQQNVLQGHATLGIACIVRSVM